MYKFYVFIKTILIFSVKKTTFSIGFYFFLSTMYIEFLFNWSYMLKSLGITMWYNDNWWYLMECDANFLHLVPGPFILCVGFILYIIGLSTTYWSETVQTGTHAGLWKVCTKDDTNTEICFNINEKGSVPRKQFINFKQFIVTFL